MAKVANKLSALEQRIPAACSDEAAAVAFLEEQRWGNEPFCPKCGVVGECVQMKAKDGTRNARFLWRCHACKQQFTVRVGTIMEDSPIPFRFWTLAFFRAASSKKGVSALQIQRETGLTYKSALFLMHRIRWAMAPANENEPPLTGTVEFDETYVGGKPRYARTGIRGRSPDFGRRKTAVVGGIERGGRVKARVVNSTKADELSKHVRNMVDPSSDLITDEAKGYVTVGREYASHQRVRHYIGEYVKWTTDGECITTNTIEGFWAGLKRQLHGTHHSVTRKHLHRYVSEAEFKYNNRNMNDGERTAKLIQAATNRRLTYAEQTTNRDSNGRIKYGTNQL